MMKRKRFLGVLLALVLAVTAGALAACNKPDDTEKTVTLSQTTCLMGVLETVQLTATLSESLSGDVVWSSSDETVATVEGGLIKSLKAGNAEITAAVTDSSGTYSAKCTIEVVMGDTRPTIYLPSNSVNVRVGGTMTLAPQALYGLGTEAADAVFSFESADSAIAAVNDAGVVTISATIDSSRSTTITVSGTAMGYTMTPKTVTVNVVDDNEIRLSVDDVALYTSDILGGDTETTVMATVYVADALNTQKTVTVANSTPSVATYDEATGKLTAIAEGETEITFSITGTFGTVTSRLAVTVDVPVIEKDVTLSVGKNRAFIDLSEIEDVAFAGVTKVRLNDTKTDAFVSAEGSIVNLDASSLDVYRTLSFTLIDDGAIGYKVDARVVNFALYNETDLKNFFESTAGLASDQQILLMGDIDCTSLGAWNVPERTLDFAGIFDGQGFAIKNLKVINTGVFYQNTGTIKDVAFIGLEKNYTGSITTADKTIGLFLGGDNTGTIDNVFIQGVNNHSGVTLRDMSGTATGMMCNNNGTLTRTVVIASLPNATTKLAMGYRHYGASFDSSSSLAIVAGASVDSSYAGAGFYEQRAGTNSRIYASVQALIAAEMDFSEIYTESFWSTTGGVPLFKQYADTLKTTAVEITNGLAAEVSQSGTLTLSLVGAFQFVRYSISGGSGISVNAGVVTTTADASGTAVVRVTSIFDDGNYDEISVIIKNLVDKSSLGIQGYLEKAGDKQSVDMSGINTSIGGANIIGVTVGTVTPDSYVLEGGKLIVAKSALSTLSGEVDLDIDCDDNKTYRFRVFVADYALETAIDVQSYFNGLANSEGNSGYTVVSNNINMNDLSDYATWLVPETTNAFSGTFDGLGNTIIGLKVQNTGAFADTHSKQGKIRNIAFIGMEKHYTGSITTNKTYGFFIGGDAGGTYGNLENIFIQGTDYSNAAQTNGFSGNLTTGLINVVVIVEMPNSTAKYGLGGTTYWNMSIATDAYAVVPGATANFSGGGNSGYGVLCQSINDLMAEDFDGKFTGSLWDKSKEMPMFTTTLAYLNSTTVELANGATAEVSQAGSLTLKLVNPYPFVTYSVTGGSGISVNAYGVVTMTAAASGSATVKCVSLFDANNFDEITVIVKILDDQSLLGIQGYLEKAGSKQTIDMAVIDTVIGGETVTGVLIDGVPMSGYTIEDGILTVEKSALSGISGEVNLDIVCTDTTYRFRVLVVDYALSTPEEVQGYFNTVGTGSGIINDYVVLIDDIDMSELEDYATWVVPANTREFKGTFDGLGNILKNLKIDTSGVFYKITAGGTMKNIAFVDVIGNNATSGISESEGFILGHENSGTVENVFISGTQQSGGWNMSFVRNNNGVLKNVILIVDMPSASTRFAIGLRTYGSSVITDCYSVLPNANGTFQTKTVGVGDAVLLSSVAALFTEFDDNGFPATFEDWLYDSVAGTLSFFGQVVVTAA